MLQQFYIGIVESRNDPLKLGRYQVRVFGVHTESLQDIPITSLPWAVPLVNAGAALSGIGNSSVGYLEGTMVSLFFMDGESKQQPIIMGAVHGIPVNISSFGSVKTSAENIDSEASATSSTQVSSTVQATNPNTLLDSAGNPVVDSSGNAVKTTGTVNPNQLLKDALGKRESSNNYKAENQLHYIGKYQMGAPMLQDLGYVKAGTTNAGLSNPDNWTGKSGITSKSAFLNSPDVQESAMDSELALNEKRLTKLGVIDSNTTAQEKAGYLATSHLLGTGGARDMKNGVTKQDANGVTGQSYYSLGYKAVSGSDPVVAPDTTTSDNPSRQKSVIPDTGSVSGGSVAGNKDSASTTSSNGFADPAGKYPKYLKEQDTNRLARNQNIDKTIVPHKEETEEKNVPIAGGGTWNQSSNPYNATYPFNNVYESESGHIMEFDDTPNNERIHLYHKSGTFQEIDRNGTEVRKIIGDKFEIWERNGYVLVKGTCNLTVMGNANILVENACNLDIGGDLNANIGGNANWSVGGDWKVKSSGVNHQSSSGGFAVDAETVNLNSGESTAGSLSDPTVTATGVPTFSTLSLEPRGFSELSDFETDELSIEQAAARKIVLQSAGLTDINPVDATIDESKTEQVDPAKVDPITVQCSTFVSGKININDFISANFRLRDLTKGQEIPITQSGLSDIQLACNLKMLAENVLEPIKKKYPDMVITSGLRAPGSNSTSQHPLGMAADIQFTTKSSADYLLIAKDLYSSISSDQLILEYRSDRRRNGEPTTWIHVSFNSAGNRSQVFTMDNDKRISNFGELKAVT